jgi:hypothetical protein
VIVTFYSYKGGVGRSMALMNVGEILADVGYDVIICDFDLEAPGLERYVTDDLDLMQGLRASRGVIDLLEEYRETLAGSGPVRAETNESISVPEGFYDINGLWIRRPSSCAVPISSPNTGRLGRIRFLGAGRRDGERAIRYSERVQQFDWSDFYQRWAGAAYVDFFREDLTPDQTIVLVDSRTGVTEHAGICTHHLADLVVLLSAANDINIEGTKWMASAIATADLDALRGGRPLLVMPVAARVETASQIEELAAFRERFEREFANSVPAAAGDPRDFIRKTEIPYIPYFAFTEKVVARQNVLPHRELYGAYEALALAVVKVGLDARMLIEPKRQDWLAPLGTTERTTTVLGRESPRSRFVREVPSRFAVAFSLAGEQRQLVLPVAQEVEAILGRSTVFYDDWYEHWIAGSDADLLLQSVYDEKTELVVLCVSGAYGDKSWTHTEYRAVRSRLMQAAGAEDRLRTFPVRVDDGEIEGVLFNEIVPDLRDKTPTEAAELIVARLNLVRGFAGDVKPAVAQWPSDVPKLQWLMAGQGEVRTAFARLLCERSPERVLLVQGASETGKSHISRQMIRNAMRLPGVVAGRFDFKGTTNVGVEIEAFAAPLGIEPPAGHTLNERLVGIFTVLRRRRQPTLLVFDTYEAAGEAKDWIESVLLPHLVSARWLRVVITGRSVPTSAGSTWESVAASTLTMKVPSPEDWLAYGRANRGETTNLEFVTLAHEFAEGKPSLLAGLLGPVS